MDRRCPLAVDKFLECRKDGCEWWIRFGASLEGKCAIVIQAVGGIEAYKKLKADWKI